MTWGEDIALKLAGASIPAMQQSCLAAWETPAAACELITLADLKSALGVTGTDSDTELQRLIDVYSSAVANYLERQLCQAAREVVYIPRNVCTAPKVTLPQWPVVSIESVELDSNVLDASAWVLNGRTGGLYPAGGTGWIINNYMLVGYTAGFDPIPPDIQDAMVQMCGSAFSGGAGAIGMTGPVKRERVEGAVTVDYYDPRMASAGVSGAGGVGAYASTLDMYRSERAFI